MTFVQTVKTAGRVVAGLQPESMQNTTAINPSLPYPEDIWPEGKDIETLESELTHSSLLTHEAVADWHA